MSHGAVSLSSYPSPKVVLKCERCELGGRFDKAALIGRVGGAEALPTLRLKLAAGLGCELARARLAGDHLPGFTQCGAHYPELLIAAHKPGS
jgi:hypothetical protein